MVNGCTIFHGCQWLIRRAAQHSMAGAAASSQKSSNFCWPPIAGDLVLTMIANHLVTGNPSGGQKFHELCPFSVATLLQKHFDLTERDQHDSSLSLVSHQLSLGHVQVQRSRASWNATLMAGHYTPETWTGHRRPFCSLGKDSPKKHAEQSTR